MDQYVVIVTTTQQLAIEAESSEAAAVAYRAGKGKNLTHSENLNVQLRPKQTPATGGMNVPTVGVPTGGRAF